MIDIKVLIIEDDTVARTQLARAIEKEGFSVITAENGACGLEIFRKQNPEIVFTDLKMPEIDGMEVVRTVKKESPDTQVIITTAFGETDTVISAIHEGVLDYLKKPIDLYALFLALGRAKEKIVEQRSIPLFPTILLVEDETLTRERLAHVLQQEQWHVRQAGNGVEALDFFVNNKVDVVLLDIKMPEMDGLTALQKMRAIRSDFAAIMITGYGDETSAIQAMRDGACNFLKKPIDLEQMIIAIEKALERLTIESALRFRTRELQLAEQIIARITLQKQIILDFGNREHPQARSFARDVLDCLPVGLVVFDAGMHVRFINNHLTAAIQYEPVIADQEFVASLKKASILDISWSVFTQTANAIFKQDSGALTTIKTGPYSYLTFVGLLLLERDIKEKVVMVAVRGERA